MLNQEVINAIRFEKELPEQLPGMLLDSHTLLELDLSLPVIIDKDKRLTLRPYTIHTKPYEDPVQGLPPPVVMNTEIGPGGGVSVSSGVGIVVVFDAESLLRRMFWKSERAKRRNAKRVQAHKYY